jgi:hypothetical protein
MRRSFVRVIAVTAVAAGLAAALGCSSDYGQCIYADEDWTTAAFCDGRVLVTETYHLGGDSTVKCNLGTSRVDCAAQGQSCITPSQGTSYCAHTCSRREECADAGGFCNAGGDASAVLTCSSTCRADGECAAGSFCDGGACKPLLPRGADCFYNRDHCAAGLSCVPRVSSDASTSDAGADAQLSADLWCQPR